MFDHRWGKGKGTSTLPNGEKLAWITVGGRTSCYAPGVQKKTGHVAPGIKEEALDDADADEKPPKAKGKKAKTHDAGKTEVKPEKGHAKRTKAQADEEDMKPKIVKANKSTARAVKAEEEVDPPRKKSKKGVAIQQRDIKKTSVTDAAVDSGRRRSTRLSNVS